MAKIVVVALQGLGTCWDHSCVPLGSSWHPVLMEFIPSQAGQEFEQIPPDLGFRVDSWIPVQGTNPSACQENTLGCGFRIIRRFFPSFPPGNPSQQKPHSRCRGRGCHRPTPQILISKKDRRKNLKFHRVPSAKPLQAGKIGQFPPYLLPPAGM